ncbi:MAG: hypothetical protein IJO64_02995 [Clostridia bacterium]|nr:hypothetical protein [Clostridia bacterium]
MLRNIATVLSVTVEELLDGECTVQIQAVSKETQPALRFIGKRYNGNESIYIKWKLWKDNHWFSILENLNIRYANSYIGAKRIVSGRLEYWIGMLFLPDADVPEGFEYIDIDKINLANFQLKGTAHKITSFETHNLCLDELDKNGMIRFEDHWCFECYDDKSIDYIGTDKSMTIDYKISIL